MRLKAKELEVPLLKVFQDGGELVGSNLLALEKFTSGPQPEHNEHQALLWWQSRPHVERVYRLRGLFRKYEGEFRRFDPKQWGGDPLDGGTETWERSVTVSYAALNWWTQHQLRPVFGSQPLAGATRRCDVASGREHHRDPTDRLVALLWA